MKDELDLLKWKESTGCDIKVVSRMEVDAKGNIKSLADGLSRNICESNSSIQHSMDHSLVELSKRLTEMFDRVAMALQPGVIDAVCTAVAGVQESFVDASKVVNRSLSFNVELQKRDESARPRSSSAHSVNYEPRQSRTGAASNSGGVTLSNTPRSLAPGSHGATNPHDYLGRC